MYMKKMPVLLASLSCSPPISNVLENPPPRKMRYKLFQVVCVGVLEEGTRAWTDPSSCVVAPSRGQDASPWIIKLLS
jgi:hypothetical protein